MPLQLFWDFSFANALVETDASDFWVDTSISRYRLSTQGCHAPVHQVVRPSGNTAKLVHRCIIVESATRVTKRIGSASSLNQSGMYNKHT